jgi:isoquinoline 1-oxidoreductase subunit beta
LHKVRIGMNHGWPVVWEHKIVGQGVFRHTFVMPDPAAIDSSSVEGVKDSPYLKDLPDYTVQLHTSDQNVPVLPWRSVGKSHTCFVMETLVDEMAHSEKKDPLEFRKQLLKDNSRYLGVLNLVEEKSGWKQPPPKGISRGVSVYEGNGSYIAYVVELSVNKGKIRVNRVVCVADCGLVVNPDGVVAQMEGCIVFGLSAALYGEITMSEGKVEQSNFHDYKLLRLNEMPKVEVYIMESTGQIGGAGEPGVPGIAPALTNALFVATGKRIRRLPVKI